MARKKDFYNLVSSRNKPRLKEIWGKKIQIGYTLQRARSCPC